MYWEAVVLVAEPSVVLVFLNKNYTEMHSAEVLFPFFLCVIT